MMNVKIHVYYPIVVCVCGYYLIPQQAQFIQPDFDPYPWI